MISFLGFRLFYWPLGSNFAMGKSKAAGADIATNNQQRSAVCWRSALTMIKKTKVETNLLTQSSCPLPTVTMTVSENSDRLGRVEL